MKLVTCNLNLNPSKYELQIKESKLPFPQQPKSRDSLEILLKRAVYS